MGQHLRTPDFAEFAAAFCAGYIACRDGLKEVDGEEFMKGVIEAFKKSPRYYIWAKFADN